MLGDADDPVVRGMSAGAQRRVSGCGLGGSVAMMGVQKNRPLILQARQAAGEISGETLKIISAHLIDGDQNGELGR